MNNKFILAKKIVSLLTQKGFQAFIVGGAVRDYKMEKIPEDFDIATSALPDEIEDIFHKTIPVGKQFGVIIVRMGGENFEVATFRKDQSYHDGRRPSGVTFSSAKEDVERRDFTINGLFWHPINNEIIDYVKGLPDLKNKLIRCIGSPHERFNEDRLRIIRAIRFASNLNFTIEEQTWEAVCDLTLSMDQVSSERLKEEFSKILSRSYPAYGLSLLKKAKRTHRLISPTFFPEETPFPLETYQLFEIEEENQLKVETSLALLYLSSQHFLCFDSNKKIFHINTKSKSQIIQLTQFLKSQTFSNKTVKNCQNLIELLLSLYRSPGDEKVIGRKFLGHHLGEEAYLILKKLEHIFQPQEVKSKYLEKLKEKYPLKELLPSPLIGGKDLTDMQIKPGPLFSKLINRAYEIQLLTDIKEKVKIIDSLKKENLL